MAESDGRDGVPAGETMTAPKGDAALTRSTPCKKCGLSLSQHILTRTKDDMVTPEPDWCGSVIPLLDRLASKEEECERLRFCENKQNEWRVEEKARADRLAAIVEAAPHELPCTESPNSVQFCSCWKRTAKETK